MEAPVPLREWLEETEVCVLQYVQLLRVFCHRVDLERVTERVFLRDMHDFLEFRVVCHRVNNMSVDAGVDRNEIEVWQENAAFARASILRGALDAHNAATIRQIEEEIARGDVDNFSTPSEADGEVMRWLDHQLRDGGSSTSTQIFSIASSDGA
jgi:hypothetical protein